MIDSSVEPAAATGMVLFTEGGRFQMYSSWLDQNMSVEPCLTSEDDRESNDFLI